VEDTKDLLILHMSNWIHIMLLNDMILTTPSLNHQDLRDVQMLDFSGLTGVLRYILTITGRFFRNFVNVLIAICSIIHSSSLTFGSETADLAASLQPSSDLRQLKCYMRIHNEVIKSLAEAEIAFILYF
jgi:hypothetical protein